MSDLPARQSSSALTDRQMAVMHLFVREGDTISEGFIANELYPYVMRPRVVANALERNGLIAFAEWWDDDAGYALRLTDAGERLVEGWRDA